MRITKDIKAGKLKYKNRIKEYRESQGITIAKLARMADIRPQTIWLFEHTGGFPRGENRAKLLAALKCSFNDLFYEVIC